MRPRPHHLETETETISQRPRPRRDGDYKNSVSRPSSLVFTGKYLIFSILIVQKSFFTIKKSMEDLNNINHEELDRSKRVLKSFIVLIDIYFMS